MADKVKPLKIENASLGGTQNDPYPTETNPTQDYLAAKGIAFENSDTYTMDISAEGNVQTRSFNSLIFAREHVPDDSFTYYVPLESQFRMYNYFKVSGYLKNDGTIVVSE
jgi:hypothetical protein